MGERLCAVTSSNQPVSLEHSVSVNQNFIAWGGGPRKMFAQGLINIKIHPDGDLSVPILETAGIKYGQVAAKTFGDKLAWFP